MSSSSSPSQSPSSASPSDLGVLPTRTQLTIARVKHEQSRKISLELKKSYDAVSTIIHQQEKEQDAGEENRLGELEYEQASLGFELAKKVQDEIICERDVVQEEESSGLITNEVAQHRHRELNRRCISAGDELWRNSKKKQRIDDPGAVRLMEPRGSGISESLLALYMKCDGVDMVRKKPKHWRSDVNDYYLGSGGYHNHDKGDMVSWCHISGMWYRENEVKAAHIVPFFPDMDQLSEVLFGTQSDSLENGGNALLLSSTVKSWFDKYHLVVVPVDPSETPIRRWRTDVISSDINNSSYAGYVDDKDNIGMKLDGKELQFLGKQRPVSRFLYFHFVMALVRIKDIGRRGWQDIWAKYYQQRPFPTPGNYLRKSMLLALATYFQTADMKVVESWITSQGFETPSLAMEDDQTKEVARRVHEAVEEIVTRAEEHESEDEGF